MLAYKDGRTVRLESRNGVDHTRRFPDLAAAVAALPGRTLVLHGEVAIFDRQLRSRFDWLRDPDPEEVGTPPLLMVFDLLHRAGRDQAKRSLRERRARLEEIVAGAERYVGGVTKSWLKVKLPGWTYPEDRWRRVRLDIEGGVKDTR